MKESEKKPKELVAELRHFGNLYLAIHRPGTLSETKIADEFYRLKYLDASTSYPMLLFLFDKYDSGAFSLENFQTSLHILQSFVIRRTVCGESSRAYSRWFPNAVDYIKAKDVDILTSLLTFLYDKGWPSDEQFKEALLKFEIYWRERRICRLVLEELEKSYSHKEPVDLASEHIQIEHIMPWTLSDEWKTMIGSKWKRVYETYLHTIGNLTLSGYNQELYNSPFPEKKKRLADSNLALNRYFENIEIWNESAIVIRGEKLADEVARLWNRPQVTES